MKTSFLKSILPLFAALILAAGCGPQGSDRTTGSGSEAQTTGQQDVPFRKDGELAFVRGDETLSRISIEIADSDSSRTRGLMQRSSLADGTGMLFIFPTVDYQSFWMANTQVSLDIIFVADDSTIVDINKYTRPLSQDNVGGSQLSRFVVEVPAGYVDTYGLVEGDRVTWSQDVADG